MSLSIDTVYALIKKLVPYVIVVGSARAYFTRNYTLWFVCSLFALVAAAHYANKWTLLPNTWTKLGPNDVVLITGGSRGLGLALTHQIVLTGAQVFNLDVVPPETHHENVTYIQCDISHESAVKRALDTLLADLQTTGSHVSVLINNAGVRHSGSLLEVSDPQIRQSFEINTLSQIWTLRRVLNHHISRVLQRQPRAPLYIVSVASVLGALAPRNLSLYSATKAANMSIYEALAQELAQYSSIRILQVVPGQLTTSMFGDLAPSPQFCAPLVNHVDLAKAITARISRGESGVLGTPLYANFLPAVRILPMSLQRFCRWISGMDNKINT